MQKLSFIRNWKSEIGYLKLLMHQTKKQPCKFYAPLSI
jgi:hypothetical protein